MRQRQFRLGVLVCVLALTVTACGGSSGGSSGGAAHLKPALDGSGGRGRAPARRCAHGLRPRGLPASRFRPDVFGVDYPVVYATPVAADMFPPNDASHPIPLLASGPPVLSDGRPHRDRARPSRRPLQPAGPARGHLRRRRLRDERAASPNVANPYFASYFSQIVGAAKRDGRPISGISTPDRYTIVFHLTGPTVGSSRRAGDAAALRQCRRSSRRRWIAGADPVRRRLPGGDRPLHAEGRRLTGSSSDRLSAREERDANRDPSSDCCHGDPRRRSSIRSTSISAATRT